VTNHQITPDAAVNWLREAQRYFSKRPTNGEDRAHWSNVYNAENAGKIADLIASLRRERDDALLAAQIVRDLATPPVSDADVERAVAEAKRVMEDLEDAKRVRQEIEGERT